MIFYKWICLKTITSQIKKKVFDIQQNKNVFFECYIFSYNKGDIKNLKH